MIPWFLALFLSWILSRSYPSLPEWMLKGNEWPYLNEISWIKILLLTGLMLLFSLSLNQAVAKTSSQKQFHHWIPWLSTLLFGILITLCRFAAWIPVEMAALAALPCVLLPPLIYRVSGEHSFPEFLPLTSQDIQIIQREAMHSPPVRRFLERYPNASVYLYQSRIPHPRSGLLLHNRESLVLPKPTMLEVTLDCPYQSITGTVADGQEILCAYLSRTGLEGSSVLFLPSKNWETWLRGMENREWFRCFQELDTMQSTYPPLGNLPFQLVNKKILWQSITLLWEEKNS